MERLSKQGMACILVTVTRNDASESTYKVQGCACRWSAASPSHGSEGWRSSDARSFFRRVSIYWCATLRRNELGEELMDEIAELGALRTVIDEDEEFGERVTVAMKSA
jgi:hypothetical protein